MKAGEVVERMKVALGIPWRDNTFRDIFKFGSPDTEITGIATTAFATMEVIEKAAAAGLNMIIPHETTFWNDRDDTSLVDSDPLYARKVELLQRHNIVIFRTHDHMHAQVPDFTYVGSAREIGLDPSTETAPNSHHFIIPETTLGELASHIRRNSSGRAIRVVGDPQARVSHLQLGVGYATPNLNSNPEVDVVISGEQQETDGGFDSPAYVMDAAALGVPKGWIMLGHAASEEAGMQEMAEWIRTFVTEVPVELIKAGDPFWSPA
jgi:putative NIF3 family GTP cyclohydrolase 1 type 2